MIRRLALARHLLGIVAPLCVLLAAPAIAPLAALAVFLGTFMLAHELAHGALGLARRRNDLALAIAGVCMATSGHALRLMHLRHHADPLGDGDLEGRTARMSPWRALAAAPRMSVLLVITAWRTATASDRRWQRTEHAAVAILAAVVAVWGPSALPLYVVVALASQALAPFWAGHLPHRSPPWLLAVARRLAGAGSLAMTTLVVHDEHHRRPKIPTHGFRCSAAMRVDLPIKHTITPAKPVMPPASELSPAIAAPVRINAIPPIQTQNASRLRDASPA